MVDIYDENFPIEIRSIQKMSSFPEIEIKVGKS